MRSAQATTIDLLSGCVSSNCVRFAERWRDWGEKTFKSSLPALIDCTREDYVGSLERNERYMIRKAANRGVSYDYFRYNDRLDDLHAIDTSAPVRGGMRMTESYRHPHRPLADDGDPECWRHGQFYIGGFRDDRLVAYTYVVFCGEGAILNRFIGHKRALTDGVMNGLVAKVVAEARAHRCDWLNYLSIESRTEGLANFKRNVGFRPVDARFVV